MILFSVIIPNFNHGKYLEDRIASVLNQTYKNFEVIILDDSSTDESKKIIQQYQNHPKVSHIVFNEKNSGSPFQQWKKGIALAKADWIWIAESDDVAQSNFLEEAVSILENNSSVGCYYSDSTIISETGIASGLVSIIKNDFFETKKWSASYHANGKDELNNCMKFLCTINNSSACVFKKEIFAAVQQEVLKFRYHGDWFFFINALSLTDIYYNNKPLSSYRNHPENFVSEKSSVVETKNEYYRILIFLLSKPEITQKKEVIRFFCLHYLGSGWIKQGMANAFTLYTNYLKADRSLALQVIPRLLWYKFTGRKNKKKYP